MNENNQNQMPADEEPRKGLDASLTREAVADVVRDVLEDLEDRRRDRQESPPPKEGKGLNFLRWFGLQVG